MKSTKQRMRRIFFTTLLFIAAASFAQKTTVDSLLKIIEKADEVQKPSLYNRISELISVSSSEEAIKYADKAFAYSQKYKNHSETGRALYNKANAFYNMKKYSEAANYAVEAIKSFTLASDDKQVAYSYILLGTVSSDKNEFEQSQRYFDNALSKYKQNHDTVAMADVYCHLGALYHKQYQYPNALEAYNKSYLLLSAIKDKKRLSTVLCNIALIYRDKGDNQLALEKLSESIYILDFKTQNKERAEVLNLIGSLYLKMRQYDQALDYYFKARDIRKELNLEPDLAAIYINIGLVYREKNMHKEALQYYVNALEIRKRLGDVKNVMITLNYIGGYYLNLRMFNEALRYYLDQLKLSIDYDDKREMANALSNIGTINIEQNNFRKAIDYLEYSLKINLELSDYSRLGAYYVLLGNAYLSMKDHMSALQCYEEALEYRRKMGDESQVASTLINIGQAYQSWTKYKKAWESFSRSIEIRSKIKDYNGMAVGYNHLGNLFMEKNDTITALSNFEQSQKYSKMSGNKYQLALCSRKIGEIYLNRRQPETALPFLQQSLSLGCEIYNLELQRKAYLALNQYYVLKQDYKKALDNYTNYSLISDSIYKRITNQYLLEKQIEAELNIKDKKIKDFEYEIQNLRAEDQIKAVELKRQKNIILFFSLISVLFVIIGLVSYRAYHYKRQLNQELKKHLAEIERANDLLRKSEDELRVLNSTKDKFFSIIAHDLRNALNGILNLTQMLISEPEQQINDKKEVYTLLHFAANQLHALLTNLLEWSRSQTGRISYNPNLFDVYELVDKNRNLLQLNADTKKISLANRTMPESFVYADKDMINTVLRNLISNAIKFTPENGTIMVQAIVRDNDVLMSVEDNGVGISEENQKNMFKIDKSFTTQGTNLEVGTGLGLILCKELVEKNKGEIWVESELGRGSRFKFTVPRVATS
jgi:signal transduction histidine kinase/uncharacterized protein HemY